MRSSREQVLALISRWQSENCAIKVVFCNVDHSLEITCPPILHARLDDDSSFWLGEAGPRDQTGMIYGVHVKLSAADGYEIINISREAHPTFAVRVNFRISLHVPFGEYGDLFAYELEKPDAKKIM